MKRTIYLTSDHGGFDLKEKLKNYLVEQGHKVEDVGPQVKDPQDDYPDYALKLVRMLRSDDYGWGIAICRSAQGMCMALNRNPGIRAGLAWSVEEAKKVRQHENSNAVCLSGDFISEANNIKIVEAWLNADYKGPEEPRHARRLDKLESYFPL
ncbi:TPA: RpiB/LacA/LacB family sugar-phosphate isomerase [Candidatus Saccharibacteria bacterium]|nr:RpiB/LacA/LacB family sugar-phosphate isomerase [Candidatus Saccharibacteria bacterium]HIO87461.1 RpiB/LacA/LacB family sugar-phosphate isomerase [Candidatus Saccharibacteria bacterium]